MQKKLYLLLLLLPPAAVGAQRFRLAPYRAPWALHVGAGQKKSQAGTGQQHPAPTVNTEEDNFFLNNINR